MTITHERTCAGSTAVYLHCYPYDSWNMASHRRALEEHAWQLGLQDPHVYLDNGTAAGVSRPGLRLLLAHTSMGLIGTVLVPGRWVFSLDAATARAVADFLRAAGAEVLELRRHGPRTGHGLAS